MNPLMLKLVGYILLAAATAGAGAITDHHFFVVPLRDKLAQQAGADAQASHDAQIAVQAQEKYQNDKTVQSADSYAGVSRTVDAAIDRMRKQPTTHDERVCAASVSSGKPAETVVQSPGTCESTGDDPCTVERSYFDNGLKDAAAVEGYAQWVTLQQFPTSKEQQP